MGGGRRLDGDLEGACVMARWWEAVGAFSARRRWWVIAAWVVLLAVSVGSMVAFAKPLDSNITIKGLQSITTLDTIDTTFGTGDGGGRVVFAAPEGGRRGGLAAPAGRSSDRTG